MSLKTSILPNETINETNMKEELEKITSFLDGVGEATDLRPNLQFIEDSLQGNSSGESNNQVANHNENKNAIRIVIEVVEAISQGYQSRGYERG